MNTTPMLRVLTCDHLNIARGKLLVFDPDLSEVNFCKGIYALGYAGDILDIPYSGLHDGFPDICARFDLKKSISGWEKNTRVVVADLFQAEKPFVLCPRHCLRQAVKRLQALGYFPQLGIEIEGYLFQKNNSNASWEPYQITAAHVYGTGILSDPDNIISEIRDAAIQSDINIHAIHSEFDPAQFEFSLLAADPVTAIDQTFLFRQLAMELAASRGYKFSFMPKPLTQRAASGLHINVSMHNSSGQNLFYDVSEQDGLSNLSKAAISACLHHHQSLAAIMAPSVNSLKRLRPGELTAYWANWGYDHRGCAIRIPPERDQHTRFEHRLADGSANPYLAAAACLNACYLGLQHQYALPAAETKDCMPESDATESLVHSLQHALQTLESDEELVTLMGSELMRHHISVKHDEWQRYIASTTDWETQTYFDYL